MESNQSSQFQNQIQKKLTNLYKCQADHCIEKLLSRINQIEEKTNEKCVDVVVIGNVNSGKTSLINGLVAVVTQNFEMPLLTTSQMENTFYQTIIENSNDNYFHLESVQNGTTNYLNKFETFKDLTEELSQLEENLMQNCLLSNNKLEKQETNSCQDIQIRIKVSNFLKNIRFIDTAGITSGNIDKIINNILKISQFPILIYVKNLLQESVIETGTSAILKFLEEKFQDGISILCLSKKDSLIKELEEANYLNFNEEKQIKKSMSNEKKRNVDKYSKNLQNFFNLKSQEYKNFGFSKIVLINSKGVLKEDKVSIQEFTKILIFIKDISNRKLENIQLSSYKLNIFNFIDEIKSKFPKKFDNKMLNKETFQEILNKLRESLSNFMKSIDTFEEFRKMYNIQIERVHKKFKELDKTIFGKKTYLNRNTYIDDQLEHLTEHFISIINDNFTNMFIDLHQDYNEKLQFEIKTKIIQSLKEKVTITISKNELKKENNDKIVVKLAATIGIIGALFLFSLKWGKSNNMKSGVFFNHHFDFNRVLIGISVIVFGYNIANYVGMWSKMNCWNDVVILFHKTLKSKLEQIVKDILDEYSKITTEIVDKSSNDVQFTKILQDIYSITKAYLPLKEDETKNIKLLTKELIDTLINENDNLALKKFLVDCLK